VAVSPAAGAVAEVTILALWLRTRLMAWSSANPDGRLTYEPACCALFATATLTRNGWPGICRAWPRRKGKIRPVLAKR
jgi:hypothetical protein